MWATDAQLRLPHVRVLDLPGFHRVTLQLFAYLGDVDLEQIFDLLHGITTVVTNTCRHRQNNVRTLRFRNLSRKVLQRPSWGWWVVGGY